MIQPSELRIGNYVLHNGVMRQIASFDALRDVPGTDYNIPVAFPLYLKDGRLQGYDHKWLSDCEPVPLTIDLLKVIKDEAQCKELGKYVKSVECWDEKGELKAWSLAILSNDRIIKHLHQLQNLYFALTGEELIISL